MSSRDGVPYTRLEAVCSGDSPGELFIAARIHTFPDLVASPFSVVVRANITGTRFTYTPIFTGPGLIKEYYSNFTCMVKDSQGVLYVGEEDGFVHHENGKTKVVVFKEMGGTIFCAYLRGDAHIAFGGGKGEIVDLCQGKTELTSIGGKYDFIQCIHGTGPDFMVAVGWHGCVAKYSHGKWQKYKSPDDSDFLSVWCLSESDIYIGTRVNGCVWHWDGQDQWQRVALDSSGDTVSPRFLDFAFYEGSLYAACGERGVFRLENDTFVAIPQVKNECVGKLTVTSSGLIGLGAGWGSKGNWFTRFDGKKWTAAKVNLKIPK